MSSLVSALAALIIPGLISLFLYYSITQIILPFMRRHQLTSEYLPLPSFPRDGTWQERIPSNLVSRMVPKAWLQSLQWRRIEYASGGDEVDTDSERDGEEDEALFGDEEGENMIGLDIDARRREILEGNGNPDVCERLSRDLEEGFRDDSDDET